MTTQELLIMLVKAYATWQEAKDYVASVKGTILSRLLTGCTEKDWSETKRLVSLAENITKQELVNKMAIECTSWSAAIGMRWELVSYGLSIDVSREEWLNERKKFLEG